MGLFDKVKEQAGKAIGQAQDIKEKVGDKVDAVQSKRKAEDLLDDLGRFLYAERTGRPMPGAEAEIQRIVDELKALESDGTTVLPESDPDAGPHPDPAPAPAPPDPPVEPVAESPLPPDLPA